jgi:hypothetical protein
MPASPTLHFNLAKLRGAGTRSHARIAIYRVAQYDRSELHMKEDCIRGSGKPQ